MSDRQYPRLGAYHKPKKYSGRQCAVCKKAPAGLLDVEVNWFRGDDLTIACCGDNPCQRAILGGKGWPK